jgi:hypothetical protein
MLSVMPAVGSGPFGRIGSMIWTAWNNGKHHASGAGYGFKIAVADRDRHFQRGWDTVSVELPQSGGGPLAVEVNIAKDSFWSEECREVIHHDGHGAYPELRNQRPMAHKGVRG